MAPEALDLTAQVTTEDLIDKGALLAVLVQPASQAVILYNIHVAMIEDTVQVSMSDCVAN